MRARDRAAVIGLAALLSVACQEPETPRSGDARCPAVQEHGNMADKDAPSVTIDEETLARVRVAVEFGLAAVDNPAEFVPFAIFEAEKGRVVKNYLDDGVEAILALARADIRRRATGGYAIGYLGRVTHEGAECEAIFIEATEHGDKQAHIFAQRYERAAQPGDTRKIGKLMYGGARPSAFDGGES